MSDDNKAKKEGRFINVLSFSLMLDRSMSLSPTIEVSRLDPEQFVEYMDSLMPDFDYTHDIANLIGYCSELVEHVVAAVEEYCGPPTFQQDISEPTEKQDMSIEEVYKAIKSKKLN
jgi:hypothetical protein